MENKMEIEIWSDVMCPFCYLGKRKFETALAGFAHRDALRVTWKSFQLMPELKTDASIPIHEFLAREKGFDRNQAIQMNQQVARSGRQAGLHYDFDRVVVANTFNAHRLIQFARQRGLQNEAEERLFQAFFAEGKNVDDLDTLQWIGTEIGLNADELSAVLHSDAFAGDVQHDIQEARELGIGGVPFFVLDRKYAVSGAQEPPAFLTALERSYAEWKGNQPMPLQSIGEGASCTPDGDCS